MLLDAAAILSDDQTLVFAVGTALSDKSYDMGAGGSIPQGGTAVVDVGRGMEVQLLCQITTTYLASGGASTLKVELVMADDAALGTNLVVLQSTAAIAKATLVAGYQFRLRALPHGLTSRYLGCRYTIATNDGTTGTIKTALVWSRQADNQAGV